MATHRPAKPCTPVRFRSWPPLFRSGEFSSIALRTNFFSAGKLQIIEPGRFEAGLFENRLKFETLEAFSISSALGMQTVMSLTQ